MTIASALEVVLAAVVLGLAVWTIAARDTFSAVAGFVAYGLLLALLAGATVSQLIARAARDDGPPP